MASFTSLLGGFWWICEGELDPSSYCVQRRVIDAANLIFLIIFYLSLFVGSVRRPRNIPASNTRDWVFVVAAICCVLTGISYFGLGLWNLLAENGGLSWVFHFLRGLIWNSLALSLFVKGSKWVKILSSVWWISLSFLSSALTIEILLKTHSIRVFHLLTWCVNLLLLFCAFKSFFSHSASENIHGENLSEPMLDEKRLNNLTAANFFSKLIFSWINPLISLGYSKPLSLEDVSSLPTEDEADLAYRNFAQAWDCLVRKKSPGDTGNLVLQAVTKVHFKENIFIAVCALLRTLAVSSLPLLLYSFINCSSLGEEDLSLHLSILGYLVLSKIVESLSQRHWFFNSRRSGMRMRSALMVAVYRKQLKLSNLGRRRHSTGEIVNYIAVDAYRMGEFLWWFHSLWSFTLQLFLSVAILFGLVGVGALPGLVLLLICGFLNVPFAKMLQTCQSQFMIAQDERLRATSEILNSMKIIKLQSWEDKFKKLIESLRAKEFIWLAKSQFIKVYCSVLFWMSPTIIYSVVFVGCWLLESVPLNASIIFTSLAILRSMSEPVRIIPEALSAMIQVKISFDRINAFLLNDELNKDEARENPEHKSEKIVSIEAGNFNWDPEVKIPTLREVSLEIKRGQKIAVCGSVGAGKSSLLYAILGEISKVSGTVNIFGSIAYVSQTSWIQSGTIRDNILFGKSMDSEKYNRAIKACGLDKDIDSFDHGDHTEIGQRGLNLSGGQKQRIQLARAVYNDADIYILDDPFSAVDAHTAAILFNECVMSALEKKTVILVTHQVEFLSQVERVLELLIEESAFKRLVNAHKDAITVLSSVNTESRGEYQHVDMIQAEESNSIKEHGDVEISFKGKSGVQLTEEEEREIGDIGWKPFIDYIVVSKGFCLLFLSTLVNCFFLALQAAATFWLALAIQIPKLTTAMLVGVYAGISTFSAVFIYIRSSLSAQLGLRASETFFSGFNNSIFKAPMLFFDSTPIGRILTRASSDLSVLDFDIPIAVTFVMAGSMELVTVVGTMACVTWQVLIVVILAIIATKYVQDYYLASARELIRINGTTKAPVMNYAAETSLGVVTIRAFNMTDRFFKSYLKLVDSDAALFFHLNAAMEWIILRIETLQNVTLFTAALLLVLLPKGFRSPGLVGLSLSYALSLTSTQVFFTRWYCNLSNYIVSVERLKQFMHIPPEPPAIVEDQRPPSSWPFQGRIELQELKVRYHPNAPLILKGITCTFKEGTRIGVVGRTGSGKTTLITALFRLIEPADGCILIDGINICSVGVKDLRMKLSIIPQEPTLFQGSVRTNLDPLGLFSDDEIWQALDKCQLKYTIRSLPNKLDSSVSDDGENWSAGQRQLICLGRVLLKRNKILVLDEATASIDSATDATLQRVIKQEFSECTVITVAHRVPTVMDSDMVMVLSFGELVEYDEPSKLMESNSSFSKLVAEYWSSCRGNSN